jgi:hypothetical protein
LSYFAEISDDFHPTTGSRNLAFPCGIAVAKTTESSATTDADERHRTTFAHGANCHGGTAELGGSSVSAQAADKPYTLW